MKAPTIPANESERLAALQRYKVLDTLPEREFDDLTLLAADICDTPIALVSLVDRDRQWFKARVGIDAAETLRDISFCGHVVADRSTLVVPDATQDIRFADNPLVAGEPDIRFYAGAPLVTPDDHVLGTLCVIDRKPKKLTPQQVERLEALSRMVVSHLELRRKNTELQKLSLVASKTHNLAVVTDAQGRIEWANESFYKLTGYTLEEIIGRKPGSFLQGPETSPETVAEIREALRQKQPFAGEILNYTKAGTPYWLYLQINPIFDATGQLTHFIAVEIDITERKRMTRELKESRQFLELVLDTVPLQLFWKDRQYVYQGCNQHWATMAGFESPDDVVGITDDQLPWTQEERDWYLECDRNVITTGQAMMNINQSQTQADGQQKWRRVNKVPIQNATGEVVGLLGTIEDITARVEGEMALKQQLSATEAAEARLKVEIAERTKALSVSEHLKARLQESNRELQDFAYVSSHDLQEPLRKIQAFGDRLKRTSNDVLSDKSKDYLDRMLNAAERAQTLINDLLSFSRVTTKAKPFDEVDLAKVLAGVLSDLEIRIEQTNATVEVDPLPVIRADALQMRQILQNLISNALKFQQTGIPPVVQVRSRLYTHASKDYCELRVIDNGIGFEQKYADRIFGIFERLHGRKEYQGSGIGLAICRKIAERHGGSLTAQSEPGQGATFVLTLPVEGSPASYIV